MYTHYNTTISRAADSMSHVPSPQDATTASAMHFSTNLQKQQYHLGLGELDMVQLNSEMSYNNQNSSGSGGSSYMGSPSSMASYETQRLMQRSVSSHSLQKTNNNGPHNAFSAFFAELLESSHHDGPVRRVYSTGDLHRINGMQHYHHSDSPLSSESSMIIEGMNRASPYSPEEKKARIERYKTKRNQRNFNKKIKYACRKTLADSRPRIRGRFARNDEIVTNPHVQWSHIIGDGEEADDEDENWDNFFNTIVPESLDHEPHCSNAFDVLY
ncbi:hypothetical protein Lal_00034734 [Lupinus albus]|uniref:Putative transcription factor C2C2-CO-like family n=1 Tax=Lupinus albus TaxID=3870 RepID=A0A6A5PJ89_LUPAL|nr:putative transcription factor C2C2-CO-like family [Lupinus albus]KAF1897032.1 hypothetical protein Lal_00034734 [Lupinus albus]